MITTRSIEGIIALIILVFAYIIAGTIAGFSQAWMANRCGDTTAEDAGLLTLNPLVHIDIIGMLFLVTMGIGWTKHVPINPLNISGRLKLILVSCTNILVYIIQALIALVILELSFGLVVSQRVFSGNFSIAKFAAAYPTHSSATLLFGFLLVGLIYICVLLAVLDFIITMIHLFARFYAPHLLYDGLVMFLLSLLALYTLAPYLQLYIARFILITATLIAHLFGI